MNMTNIRKVFPKSEMKSCNNNAQYRFTWPGEDESFICEKHAVKLKTITETMGFHLQLIPFPENKLSKKDSHHIVTCKQKYKTLSE